MEKTTEETKQNFLQTVLHNEKRMLLCAFSAAALLATLIAVFGCMKDAKRADAASQNAARLLEGYRAEQSALMIATGGNGIVRESVLPLDGVAAVGTLSIPSLELTIVVGNTLPGAAAPGAAGMVNGLYPWQSGCLLMGSGYDAVFGRLKEVQAGDEVRFTDITGSEYAFTACDETQAEGYALALSDGKSILYCKAA